MQPSMMFPLGPTYQAPPSISSGPDQSILVPHGIPSLQMHLSGRLGSQPNSLQQNSIVLNDPRAREVNSFHVPKELSSPVSVVRPAVLNVGDSPITPASQRGQPIASQLINRFGDQGQSLVIRPLQQQSGMQSATRGGIQNNTSVFGATSNVPMEPSRVNWPKQLLTPKLEEWRNNNNGPIIPGFDPSRANERECRDFLNNIEKENHDLAAQLEQIKRGIGQIIGCNESDLSILKEEVSNMSFAVGQVGLHRLTR